MARVGINFMNKLSLNQFIRSGILESYSPIDTAYGWLDGKTGEYENCQTHQDCAITILKRLYPGCVILPDPEKFVEYNPVKYKIPNRDGKEETYTDPNDAVMSLGWIRVHSHLGGTGKMIEFTTTASPSINRYITTIQNFLQDREEKLTDCYISVTINDRISRIFYWDGFYEDAKRLLSSGESLPNKQNKRFAIGGNGGYGGLF